MSTFSDSDSGTPVLVGSFCAPIRRYIISRSGQFHYQGDIQRSAPSPSYIIQSPCKRFIYCTVETVEAATSGVMSFRYTSTTSLPGDDHFEFISQQPAEGGAPCFLSVDANNSYLIASNYFGGNISVFPIDDVGSLSPACQVLSFNTPLAPSHPLNRGSGHCHQTVHLSQSQTILLCELGQNAVYSFAFNSQNRELCHSSHTVLEKTSCWLAPPASGPRHLVPHPSEEFIYVLSEISCTVVALAIDPKSGRITAPSAQDSDEGHQEQLHFHSTLRLEERQLSSETFNAAEILLSSDARFLYVSNRDIDVAGRDRIQDKFLSRPTRCSVAVFAVLDGGARLQHVQQVSTLGCHPRAITLLGGGTHLVVANKDEGYQSKVSGGNFVVFRLDAGSGEVIEDSAVVSEDMEVAVLEPTWIHILSK